MDNQMQEVWVDWILSKLWVSVCCTFVRARVESLQRLSTSFYWFAGGHGSNISPWPMKLLMVWNGISRLITLTYLQIFVLSVDKVLLSTCWWWHFKWQFAYKCLLNAGRCLLAVVLCESAYHKTWQDIKQSHHTKMGALDDVSLSPLDFEVSGRCFSGKSSFPFLRGWLGESASLFDVSHMCSIRCQTFPSIFFTCQDSESCASHKLNQRQVICCIIMEHDGMTCCTMFCTKCFLPRNCQRCQRFGRSVLQHWKRYWIDTG